MDEPRWDRIKALFAGAAELSGVQRAAYLDRECAGEMRLRQEVEELLLSLAGGGGFLASPTNEAAQTGAGATTMGPPHEGPGMRIGPYKILQLIGEGGFGSVFMAEQERPVARKVALKIIKLGMDTRQVIARFEAERQALAMMDHPNIARVLDAGATEAGRPYFVMDLVKGDPIEQYCDKNNLSIPDRLELFAQVCQAVQHAHTKGVIHRDIKPSNILVATQDGRAVAKVIDFGIAKATSSRLTEKTLFTEHRALIGTPEYMSPEQAEGSLDIDTRTDVYSLGVLLYELLTGSTPFGTKELRSAAYAEMQRIIREVEPPNPSTRLSQSADTIASVAAKRKTEPRKLGTMIRGELDWIVMKALEKDRSRRYESANGLAADIQRYLTGEAVVAAPPGRMYRVRKFVRRHRAAVAAVLVVAGVLLLGIAGTTAGLISAQRERRLAVNARADEAAQRAMAQTRLAESEATVQFLDDMLAAADPLAMGKDVTVRAVLDWASGTVGSEFADRPVVAARVHATIGLTYMGLGEYAAAEPQLREALETRRRVLGEDHPDTLVSLNNMGLVLLNQGKLKEAEPLFRQSLKGRRKVLGEDDRDTLDLMNNLGALLGKLGRPAEGEPLLREAVEKARRVLGEEDRYTLRFLGNLGGLLMGQGRVDEVEPIYRDVMDKRRRTLGDDHLGTLMAISSYADLLRSRGRLSEAEPYLREALERKRRVLGEEHPATVRSIASLAMLLSNQGKLDEAAQGFRAALEINRRRLGPTHPDTLINSINLGGVLVLQGQHADALALLAPVEGDVRGAFPNTGASRPAFLLLYLGRARGALAKNPAEFAIAEANLLEAQRLFAAGRPDSHEDVRDSENALADLYTAWNAAEPGKGHDAQTAQWRAKVESGTPAPGPDTKK